MNEFNIAWFGLLGAAIGAIPSLLSVVIPWLRDRDKLATDKRALEVAKIEVEFISSWIDAAAKLPGADMDPYKAFARERLSRLLGSPAPPPKTAPLTAGEKVRVKGGFAFLVYLGFYCFLLFGASIDSANNVSFGHLLDELMGDSGGVYLFLLVPLIVFFLRWRLSVRNSIAAAALEATP
jgi:hypothetical protein